jgi:predicted transcriptional regulator
MASPTETLRTAAHRYERERAKLEARSLKNTEARDKAIRKAHEAGMTMREIANIAGLSHQRVNQVIKGD